MPALPAAAIIAFSDGATKGATTMPLTDRSAEDGICPFEKPPHAP
jgi:hypothetical protein